MQSFEAIILSKPELEPEAIFRFILKTSGWKENNFQVMSAIVSIFILVSKMKGFSKASSSLVIAGEILLITFNILHLI
jgi:hypothetical protein